MQTDPDGVEHLRQLFHEHVPEIANGTVEIKAIAREPGHRSTLVVYSSDRSIDPVGACVGLRGNILKPIVLQMAGEKIDIVRWSESPEEFIRNLLAPHVVKGIVFDAASGRATVTLDCKRSGSSVFDPVRLRFICKLVQDIGWELVLVES